LAREQSLGAAQLLGGVEPLGRRRGVLQLRELVPLVDRRMESRREAWTPLAIHDAGLPLPEPQVWSEVDGVPTYRLDIAYVQRLCSDASAWNTTESRRTCAPRSSLPATERGGGGSASTAGPSSPCDSATSPAPISSGGSASSVGALVDVLHTAVVTLEAPVLTPRPAKVTSRRQDVTR
jgi:hypothetical protein